MRSYGLNPLWRSSSGIDHRFYPNDDTPCQEGEDNYPPCSIIRPGEDTCRVTLARAQFKSKKASLAAQQNRLTVTHRWSGAIPIQDSQPSQIATAMAG